MRQAEQEFVERMGVILASDGLTRIAGRIFGLLLLTPDDASLDEIAEALGVSKASVSLDARRLEQRGFVQRVSRPGDRRDYYRVAANLLAHIMEQRVRRWRILHDTVTDARVALAGDVTPEVERRLDRFAAGSEYILGILADALARWTGDHERSAADATTATAAAAGGRGRAVR